MYYAKVIINNKTASTDELYTYRVGHLNIKIGQRVIVPFGMGGRLVEAYIFSIEEQTILKEEKIKSIKAIAPDDIGLTENDICVIKWMKEKYLCKYIDALLCFIPTGASIKATKLVKYKSSFLGYDTKSDVFSIMKIIESEKEIPYKKLINKIGKDKEHIINRLEKDDIIEIVEVLSTDIKKKHEKIISLVSIEQANAYINAKKNAKKQINILNALIEKQRLPYKLLRDVFKADATVMRTLEKNGLISIEEQEVSRLNHKATNVEPIKEPDLTEEQLDGLYKMIPAIKKKEHRTFLVHGVTGSGKTELYMQVIKRVLEEEKRVIVMVPEIALTYHLTQRFIERFGIENVAIIHSRISKEKRYEEWLRIKNNQASIVIGARSSVFAPVDNLGAIIVDEEHESSFKSDSNPRYNAIEIAKERTRATNGILVLGSATPTIGSYYETESGENKKIELVKRYNNNPLPKVKIIDMRDELKLGNKSMFSHELVKEINEKLSKKQQIILFLNRRGYASFISCRSCGYVVKCPECDISMTYHQGKQKAICHYCGIAKSVPTVCPECDSKYIKYFGAGTEQLEAYTNKMFPDATVDRLDFDTSRKQGGMANILDQFMNQKTDILIGTQIVAKGLDFPNIGLVGIIASDATLNLPDYRSRERTFQLIAQAAGRSGRGDTQGDVVIQTYSPEHFAITTASQHNYKAFYDEELMIRKQLEYPPFSDIIQLIVSAEDEGKARLYAEKLTESIKKYLGNNDTHRVLGPMPAPRLKINNQYRFQILLKVLKDEDNKYRGMINMIKDEMEIIKPQQLYLSIDINPFSFI